MTAGLDRFNTLRATYSPAIVLVSATNDLGDDVSATAFHLGDGIFATARHAVDGLHNRTLHVRSVEVPIADLVVFRDEVIDVALIVTELEKAGIEGLPIIRMPPFMIPICWRGFSSWATLEYP